MERLQGELDAALGQELDGARVEAREQGKQKAGAFYGAGGTRVTGGCGCKLRWCLEYGSGGVGRKLKQSARERGR